MGFGNHRSPPVSILEPGISVLAVFHLSARRTSGGGKSGMFNTVGYPRVGPRVWTILNIPDQCCAECLLLFPQRSDGRWDDHYAQQCLSYGVLPRVTRCPSDLSVLLPGRSGVTMRGVLPSTITGLTTLREGIPATQGKPPSLSPGPLSHPTDEQGGKMTAHQPCVEDGGYTQGV